MKKIAVLGGTFNPIHNGHLNLALNAKKELSLDKVFFVPTNISPHKDNEVILDANTRLEMCRLAIQDYQYFEVSDIEILRQGISYTYQTLSVLKKNFPYDKIFLIVGADMFMTLESWKNTEKIFELSVICTVARGAYDIEKLNDHAKILKSFGAEIYILNITECTISSTEVRDRVLKKQKISDLVPTRVEEYILKNKLYMGAI